MLSLERQNEWREQLRTRRPGWRPTEVFAGEVRRRLGPDVRLLDLGCGRGGLVEQLDHPLALLTGVDPDLSSVRDHRLPEMPRAVADSDRLPFSSETFDITMASWLLEHLARPELTFSEVGRVLRQGGAFVFITPNTRHPLSWANRAAGGLGAWQGRFVSRLYGRDADDTFSTRYAANSATAIAELATGAGLRVHQLLTVSDPTYLAFSPALFRFMVAFDDRLPADRFIHLVGVLLK